MTLKNKGFLKANFLLCLDSLYRIQKTWTEILPFFFLSLSKFCCFSL